MNSAIKPSIVIGAGPAQCWAFPRGCDNNDASERRCNIMTDEYKLFLNNTLPLENKALCF